MLYDGFLVLAIWMTSTTIIVGVFNDGEPVRGLAFQSFLYLELFFFYFVFWKIKGQTLGMQVWKIKTINSKGEILTTNQCLLRFLTATISFALFGAGFLWALFSKDKSTWHDQISATRVIYLGSNPYKSELGKTENTEDG